MPVILSGTAAFLGAFLLFLAQPLLAKALLPRVGGSPAVWNAVQAFFQAALLVGYAWAHGVVARAGPRKGPLVQVPLIAAALGLLLARGLLPAAGDAPPALGSPLPWTLLALALGAGPAVVALATTAPLVQAWLVTREPARDPRPLYAASNAGSLLGLLVYPLAVEPFLSLPAQATAWIAGFAAWGLLLLGLGIGLRAQPAAAAAPEPPEPLPRWQAARWLALAALPASLSLSVTQYLSTDMTPMPLLWVAPLAVYLLTWILAFGRRLKISATAAARSVPGALVALATTVALCANDPFALVVAVLLAGLFITGLACHARIAAEPPPRGQLTRYYLLLAAGGAAGGAFNAFLAPLLFSWLAELPLAVCLAALLLPHPERATGPPSRRERALDLLHALGVVVAYLAVHSSQPRLAAGIAAVAVYLASRRPVRLFMALVALSTVGHLVPATDERQRAGTIVLQERTFFGIHRVCREAGFRALVHGSTLHGLEREGHPDEPLVYYHRQGPLGAFVRALEGDARLARVGAIGLGAGSAAAYAPAGARWTFVELDPTVARIAEEQFGFLARARARAQVEVLTGDGRLVLEREVGQGELGALILDAFTSDAIPMHLLTREAFELYLARLAPSGLLMVHVSNRYLDLAPVLASHAASLGLAARAWRDADVDVYTEAFVRQSGCQGSHWVVLARRAEDLPAPLRRWEALPAPRAGTDWRDDYGSVLAVFGKPDY